MTDWRDHTYTAMVAIARAHLAVTDRTRISALREAHDEVYRAIKAVEDSRKEQKQNADNI